MHRGNKFICPYCYEKHRIKDCIYKCAYNSSGVLKNRDGSIKQCKFDFQKNADGTIPIKYIKKCEKCEHAKLIRFCPIKSQNGRMLEIPERACGNTFSIALIGAKESGKSNYIAVMVNEIKKKMSRNMDCSLIFCNQQTNDIYLNTYYNPLYEHATTVKGTDANEDAPPLIYSIDFYKANKVHNTITMSLYDTAGENLDNENSMLCNNQYISNASGIIILLDPLQLPTIRKKLEGKVELPEQNSDITDILSRVINLIKEQKKIKGNIDIPVALAFTKMDVLSKYDVIPDESCLRMQSEHIAKGSFVKSDFEETNREIIALLENFMADEVEQLLKQFTRYSFFGVSSLGENPVGGVKLSGEPNPIRVLDPLLWLLSINKYIKII